MRIYEFIFLKTCVIFVLLIIVAIIAIFNGMQSRYYYTLYGEMRIVNSIKQLEHIELSRKSDSFLDYTYSGVLSALEETSADSLKHPRLVSAKVSFCIEKEPQKSCLFFNIVWIESMPSIDGICVYLPTESLIIPFRREHKESGHELGWVVFMQLQPVLEDDPQWDKWLQIMELMKTESIHVSLVRGKRVLKEKVELKNVPLPKLGTTQDTLQN
jgi:hypothetical protein